MNGARCVFVSAKGRAMRRGVPRQWRSRMSCGSRGRRGAPRCVAAAAWEPHAGESEAGGAEGIPARAGCSSVAADKADGLLKRVAEVWIGARVPRLVGRAARLGVRWCWKGPREAAATALPRKGTVGSWVASWGWCGSARPAGEAAVGPFLGGVADRSVWSGRVEASRSGRRQRHGRGGEVPHQQGVRRSRRAAESMRACGAVVGWLVAEGSGLRWR